MAAANATAVKRTKAMASTVMPTASPTPIVAYRSTSICHVIGFANAAMSDENGTTGVPEHRAHRQHNGISY